MIRESHRDASLVDLQSRKHIIVPRDKCLASHRSASLIQWLKFQPLYRLLGTRGEPRHPSYKSQGERFGFTKLMLPVHGDSSTGSEPRPSRKLAVRLLERSNHARLDS